MHFCENQTKIEQDGALAAAAERCCRRADEVGAARAWGRGAGARGAVLLRSSSTAWWGSGMRGGRRFGGVGDTAGREKAAAPADEGRQGFRVAKGL